jgi:hypothetical protein
MKNEDVNIGDFLQYEFDNSRCVFKVYTKDIQPKYYNSEEYFDIVSNGEWDYYNDEPIHYITEYCSPWTPVINEWCWFWDDNSTIGPIVKKFKEFDKIGYVPFGSVRGFKYAEPFFGTLPNCLEEVIE